MNANKLQKYIKQAQSTVYEEPEEGNFHTQLIPQMADKYLPNLSVDAMILDIGCGEGTFLDIAKTLGYPNAMGVTLSPEDAAACNSKGHCVFESDMTDLDVPDEMIAFIWCRHAIEHSPFPYFTLLEFNRVLKDGGRMYMEVPAPDCPRGHEFNPNHYSILTPNMWSALLKKAGFSVDSCDSMVLELTINGNKIPETNLCFMVTKDATPV
jgi:SAM-dependent methyltransferase